jgi:Skp family chaperone for outer membrane proteins
MSRTALTALVVWNLVLTALVVWGLSRGSAPAAASTSVDDDASGRPYTMAALDSNALRDARIAYFSMDSLRKHTNMLKDARSTFNTEETRQRTKAEKEALEIEQKMRQLLNKDQTYSTQAERQADEQELMRLNARMQRLEEQAEDHMFRLTERFKVEFSEMLQQVLQEYNETAGFDYVISMEPGGQVWVGNPGLDITTAVIEGMDRLYEAKKKTSGK